MKDNFTVYGLIKNKPLFEFTMEDAYNPSAPFVIGATIEVVLGDLLKEYGISITDLENIKFTLWDDFITTGDALYELKDVRIEIHRNTMTV